MPEKPKSTAKLSRLDIALKHAARKWRVFPLHNPLPDGCCSCQQKECPVGKHPRIGAWQKEATTDAATIKRWWAQWPDSNIGIATGAESGIIVLDIDGEAGEKIVKQYGAPKTVTVRTGKGRQMYFMHPKFKCRNKVRVYPDLDSRGDGGYVVAPGSLHASGRIYIFEEGKSPASTKLADAPQWWLDVVRDSGLGEKTSFAEGIIKSGGRNNHLTRLAGRLRDSGLKVPAIEFALMEYNIGHCQPPLSEAEVKKIAVSCGKYEVGVLEKKVQLGVLAKRVMKEQPLIATPIDKEGKGVALLAYRDGSFKPNGASIARSMTSVALGDMIREEMVTGTVAIIKELTKKDDTLLNIRAKTHINVMNGMLSWETGELIPHSPDYLSSIQLPVEWRPDTKSALLDKFLQEIFPPDAMALMEEMVGYFSIPTTDHQKAFMLTGGGSNGKSTFMKMLEAYVGPDNFSGQSLHDLEDSAFAAAELQGKLINIYHDLAATRLEKVEIFKHLVSGDPLSAQRKYGQPFMLHPFARLLFSANAFPRANDTSDAYMRRWIIIPFFNKFEGKNCDPDLAEKLRHPEVLGALLVRAVEGLRRLHKNRGFTKCESSDAQIIEYKTDNDTAFEFAQEYLRSGNNGSRITKNEVWSRYESWCKENGMKYPLAPRRFNHAISAHLKCTLVSEQIGNGVAKVWEGLQWAEGVEGVGEEAPF